MAEGGDKLINGAGGSEVAGDGDEAEKGASGWERGEENEGIVVWMRVFKN